MTKTILFAASALFLAFAAPAQAKERTFTHEGVTYTYSQTTRDDGAVVLDGIASPLGGRFHFVVRHGRVTGTANGVAVSFLVRDTIKLGDTLRVAER